MNREEFEKAILEIWKDDWYEDKANTVKKYVLQLEQQNAELQARIKELEQPKTCDGCKYNNSYWFQEKCGHCIREKFSDEYEPKQNHVH